jgi:O-antigen/teichoic acid export membrane protein
VDPTGTNNKSQPRRTSRPSYYQGVVFTGAGTAISIALLFFETMIAARVLDTESYGIYALLLVVVNFLIMIVDFGFVTALTQLIASSEGFRQVALANTALFFRLLIVIGFSSVFWLGRNLITLQDPSGVLLRYAAFIPLMLLVASLDELLSGVLQGFQAYHHMAIAQIIRSVLRLIISAVLLIVMQFGLLALLSSWIISFLVSSLYQYFVLPLPRRFLWQRPLLREILHFGLPLQGNRLLWFVSGRVDVLLLGVLVGPTGVAYYSVATRIPEALVRLAQSYIMVYFPSVTTLLAEGQRHRARVKLDHSLRLLSFALALVALTAVLFSREIVTLLFSDKYAPSSTAFALLMIALHITVLTTLMGYTLTAAGYPRRSFAQSLVRTVLTTVADLLLIPVLGFVGPALASTIAYYVTNPLCVWLLRRSGIFVTVAPYIKQTVLLWLCVALFWWAQPTNVLYKLAIIVLFLVLNASLSTISAGDLKLVLPNAVTKRLGVSKGATPNGLR